jgi:hypothetical protein
VLHSNGGWVRQGNLIAKVITDRGLNTYVEQECTSACTIAFLAGKERASEPTARLGFHSFRAVGAESKGNSTDSSQMIALETVYRHAGIAPDFIQRILETPSDKMWYPSHEELLAKGVLTRMSTGGETASLATALTSREKVAEEFTKVPAFAALAKKYPQDFDKLVSDAWAQVQARHTDREIFAAARMQIGQLTTKLLPLVSDTTLLDYNVLIAAQVEALAKVSPEACVQLIFPTANSMNVAALMPPELGQREFDLVADMIRTSDARNARRVAPDVARNAVQSALQPLSADQIDLLTSEQHRAASAKPACAAVLAYLNALNSVPIEERANTLRIIYTGR